MTPLSRNEIFIRLSSRYPLKNDVQKQQAGAKIQQQKQANKA
jgi:hypothetical protein